MNNKWPTSDQVDRWMNRTLSAEELERLERDPGLEDLKQINQAAEQLTVPARWSTTEAWNMLQARIEQEGETFEAEAKVVNLDMRPSGARRRPLYFATAVAAAVIILALVFIPSKSTSPTEYLTAAGEMETLTLPDQSQVQLNAGSRLTFEQATWASAPVVTLEGEAQFTGPHTKGFTVRTIDGVTVEVLGTTFNVQVRDNLLQVHCLEGTVRVQEENQEAVIVEAGHFLEKNNPSESILRKFDHEAAPMWTKGVFRYENATLHTVLEEIERQFGITIVQDEDVDISRAFSGEFVSQRENSDRVDASDQALEDVVYPMGYEYSWINDKTVRLSR